MLFAFGPHHPRTLDEDVPLDRRRLWLAAFAVADVRPLLHARADRTAAISADTDDRPLVATAGRSAAVVGHRREAVTGRSTGPHRWSACAGSPGWRQRPALSARFISARRVPLRKNWTRCSPRRRPSGAGAGPSRVNEPVDRRRLSRSDDLARILHRSLEGPAADDRGDEGHDRRIAHCATVADLAIEEGGIVLPARQLNAVMLRVQRLDDGFAGALATTGTAGNLRQELKRALRCAEVGDAEADIGRNRPPRASRAGNRVLWQSSACRQGRRARPPRTASSIAASAPCRRTESRSMRPIRAPGNCAAGPPRPARCRTRRAPGTAPRTFGMPSAPSVRNCSSGSVPAIRAARAVDGERDAAVRAFDRCRRTAGRTPRSRYPRRLSRTSDCSPRPRRRANRRRKIAADHDVGARSRRIPSACSRAGPRQAGDRARGVVRVDAVGTCRLRRC